MRLLGRDDFDSLLRRALELGAHGLRERRVLGNAGRKACEQAGEKDRADECGSKRGAEILRRSLETACLIRLVGWSRRHDHVAELGHQEAGADPEQRERELERAARSALRRSCRRARELRPPWRQGRSRTTSLGASRQVNEAGGSPGNGAESRRLAWNRTHRLGPSRRLLTGFTTRIAENPALSEPVRTQLQGATEQGIEIVTTEQAHAAAVSAGLTPAEADAVTADYADAQLEALKKAMLAVALLAFLSFMFTRNLPARRSSAEPDAAV